MWPPSKASLLGLKQATTLTKASPPLHPLPAAAEAWAVFGLYTLPRGHIAVCLQFQACLSMQHATFCLYQARKHKTNLMPS